MSLISTTNMKALTDKLGAMWKRSSASIGMVADQDSPTVGTIQYKADQITDAVLALADYDQLDDLMDAAKAMLDKTNIEALAGTGSSGSSGLTLITTLTSASSGSWMSGMLTAINQHCSDAGVQVSADITSLATYLEYYNGGDGGAAYSCLLCPEFGEMWEAIMGSALPAVGLMHKAIQSSYNPDASADGMGSCTYAGVFVDGDEVDTEVDSPVNMAIEVITSFASGSANPTISIFGLNNNGDTTTLATVDLGDNNPTAVLTPTITPAVTADSRQSVAISSATGIITGTCLTINSGLVDQEKTFVEAISGTTITCFFEKAHDAGATITCYRTIAASAGFRVSDITDITIAITDHDAGKVRIIGLQDRSCG